MTFRQLVSVLFARWQSVVAMVVVIVALVAAWSLLQPKQYMASATVMLDSRAVDPIASPGAGNAGAGSGYMATQIDLIQSERVALRALRALGLDKDPQWRERWTKATEGRGDADAWFAAQLLNKLDVRPSRESNVVAIGYVSTDPVFSAAAANSLVRAYIDTVLELKVEPAKQYNAFFDERARQLRTNLEQAQTRLSAYQQAKGILATDERLDVENTRLSELSTQVVVLQGIAAESNSRNGQAGANSQEVVSNVMIGNLTSDLSRQEARLNELKQRLGDRNPQVVELSANVDQLRSRLTAETRRVSGTLGVNTTVDRARLGAAQAALAEQRARVLRLRGQRDEASVLLRDVDNAQKAYDATLARVTQTGMESQSVFTNVSVLKTATPPPFATGPRVLLNIAVALVVGTLVSIAYAVLRETTDRRLRFDTDVSDALRQPLLVRIPRAAGNDSAQATRLGLRKSALVASVPRVAS